MTLKTHSTIGFLVCLAIPCPLVAKLGILVGSVFPDVSERFLAMGSMQFWRKIHRGCLHWFGWYLTLCASPLIFGRCELTLIGFGLGMGALLAHLGLDMLTPMGIPVLPFFFKKRVSIPIVKTGSLSETAFFCLCIIVAFLGMDVCGQASAFFRDTGLSPYIEAISKNFS